MSAFLGPIHFWLYNKIGKQEELTKAIAAYAERTGWIQEQKKYTKELPSLETTGRIPPFLVGVSKGGNAPIWHTTLRSKV